MSEYLSKKLTFFSFWLMVLVVILHSLNINPEQCRAGLCTIQYFLSQKLAEIAVPLFYAISGYLYYYSANITKALDLNFYYNNNKKRIKSIFIPYILWSIFWFLLMYIIQQLPIIEKYFPTPLNSLSLKEQILNLFYYPINYPFWFLRQLMVLFIFAPFIFAILKYTKVYGLFGTLILALYSKQLLSLEGYGILGSVPLFYFSLGAFLSLYKVRMVNLNQSGLVVMFAISIWTALNILSMNLEREQSNMLRVVDLLKDLIGCVGIWLLFDFLIKGKEIKNYSFYQYSFFIFAFHGIPTLLLVRLSVLLAGGNQFLLFIFYIFIIIFVISTSVIIGRLMQKELPDIYKLMVGTRSKPINNF